MIPTLYQFLGGKPVLQEGDAGKFTAMLLGQTMERLEAATLAMADSAPVLEEEEDEEEAGNPGD